MQDASGNPYTPSASRQRAAELQRDSDRLRTLYVVNDLLRQVEADGLDINLILPRLLHVASAEVGGQTGSIIITSDQSVVDHFWHIDDSGQGSPGLFVGDVIGQGIAGWVIRNRLPAIIDDTTSDDKWLPRPGHPTAERAWSAICAPLMTRTHAIGAITITKPERAQFTVEDMSLLLAIANQAATTIANADLFEESRQRAEELTTLVTATLSVSTSLSIKDILSIVSEQMLALVRADQCVVFRWDEAGEQLWPWSSFPDGLEENGAVMDLHPLAQQVVGQFQPLQFQLNDDSFNSEEASWFARNNAKSLLVLPLMAQVSSVGLVQLVDSHDVREFTNHELALVQTLSSQAAISIEHARLYEGAKRQLQESALLNKAGSVINSSLDIQEIMQSLLAQANELIKVQAISIALVDETTKELVYEVAVGAGSKEIVGLRMPASRGVSGWVMEAAQPALVPDTSIDPRFQSVGDERTGSTTRAIICAPLVTKGRVLGTIQAINPLHDDFVDADLQLLVKLANLASSAIANAQQHARTQAAEARYLGLFEDSVDPILLCDNDGTILEVNRQACDFLRYSRNQLQGMNVRQLHPESATFVTPLSFRLVSEEAEKRTSEAITSEGVPIPVDIYVKRIRADDHSLLQLIYHDITQQVELEKMREDLMAMLFHDLQSPLGNVISSLELMAHELDPQENPMATSVLDIATRSTHRLRTLIKSLLDINRLEAGHPIADRDHVSVRSMIDIGQDHLQPALERRHIQLKVVAPENLPDVYIDGDMITRVLINLLDNALKFSQDGDTLTVDVSAEQDQGSVVLTIADQGPGIPPSLRKQIFDKFYRIPGAGGRKGIGLGLAFCRLAVEAHGGRIWVENGPGSGARFRFTLPASRR